MKNMEATTFVCSLSDKTFLNWYLRCEKTIFFLSAPRTEKTCRSFGAIFSSFGLERDSQSWSSGPVQPLSGLRLNLVHRQRAVLLTSLQLQYTDLRTWTPVITNGRGSYIYIFNKSCCGIKSQSTYWLVTRQLERFRGKKLTTSHLNFWLLMLCISS